MSQRNGQDNAQIVVSVAAALLAHVALAGGLGAAEHFGWTKPHHKADVVEMVIIDKPPPPPPKIEEPPPPPPPEEKTPPPPPKIAEKVPVKPKLVEKAPPPPPNEPEPPPPAPGPETTDEAPAEPYRFEMPASAQPGGSMAVQEGSGPRGNARGTPGGKGAGGGGPSDSTTNGPRVASVASVKRQPLPDGDFDNVVLGKDYPVDALRLGIQGQVQVRLLVDDHGKVAQTKLLKGLGYGLDERALALAKKIKFKPAVDTNDQPVAMWITWSFNFTLPE